MLVVTSLENNEIIRNIIADGVKAGLGIKEIQYEIWKKFNSSDEFSLNRTTTIARTETTQIANASTLDAYKQSNVVSKKIWLTSRDMKVRPATKWDKGNHKDLEGQERNLDEPFSNGLMYPGQQSNKPEENINCRCTMLSKIKENKKGKTERFLSSDNEIAKAILWKKFEARTSVNDELIKNLFLQMFEYLGNLYVEKLSKHTPTLHNIDYFLISQTEQVNFMEKQYKPLKTSIYSEWGKSELERLV
jgi:SPP1 gp7 family putative phage head morphogenesis protein